MEKQRKFNLGKLIVLLSCLAVFAAMVTSIAVTKPIKANSAAENNMNMVTVGTFKANGFVDLFIKDFILTHDGGISLGSLYFAEGKACL